MDDVSKAISRWCFESEKEIVLLIDEVDKANNYYVFMDFLGVLRDKYIAQQSNEDKSFKSVILAGGVSMVNLTEILLRGREDFCCWPLLNQL